MTTTDPVAAAARPLEDDAMIPLCPACPPARRPPATTRTSARRLWPWPGFAWLHRAGSCLAATLALAAGGALGEGSPPKGRTDAGELSAPAPAGAVASESPAPSPAPLSQVALTVLRDALAARGPVFSADLMTRIAAGSGLAADSAAAELGRLLDELEAHRRAADGTWKALTALGGDDVDPRAADRLLRQLAAWGRKAVGGGGRYGLDLVLERSAAKARLADWQARDLLRRALDWGLSGPVTRAAPGPADLADKVGLVVTGSSSYQVDLARFRFLLLKRDDEDELDKVRDLHLPVTAALLEALPRLRQVKWAIDRPHPNLHPDCRLRFEIDEFGLVDLHAGLPVMGLTIRFALEGLDGQAHLYARTFDVTYDFYLEEDEGIQSQRRLDGVVARVARTLTDEVERFFVTRQGQD